jgi:hypothetical protein
MAVVDDSIVVLGADAVQREIRTRKDQTSGEHIHLNIVADKDGEPIDSTNPLPISDTTAAAALATANAELALIRTALQIIDNAVSGNAFAVGDATTQSRLLSILNDMALVGATTKVEGTPHASSDRGIAIWAVRDDTPVATGNDGDYSALLVNALGALYVRDTALDTVIDRLPARSGTVTSGAVVVAEGAAVLVVAADANRRHLTLFATGPNAWLKMSTGNIDISNAFRYLERGTEWRVPPELVTKAFYAQAWAGTGGSHVGWVAVS